MRRIALFLAIFVLLLVLPTGVRFLHFYRLGGGQVAPPPRYDPAQVAQVSIVPTPAAGEFVDEPTVGQGYVLLDLAHRNQFTLDEIGYLDGRLAARGFELVPFRGGDLSRALRTATSFVVLTPLNAFSEAEVRAVTDFVQRGGRLLLVGDPTRFSVGFEETLFSFQAFIESNKLPLNSLANAFNIAFNGDYLYNTVENEGNFRNILLKEGAFAEDALTDGLEKLAFYSAHSLQVGHNAKVLLRADDNTWSSATDRPGGLILAASSQQGRVLALGDIHFLLEPYYTVFDNGRFIANIADFLTNTSRRDFVLTDFPYFYQRPIDLIYTGSPQLGPGVFDEIIALQDAFRRTGQELQLVSAPKSNHDVLYLGLYNQAEEVLELLAAQGITLTIQPPILTQAQLRAQEAAAGSNGQTVEEEVTVEKEGTLPEEEEITRPEKQPVLRLIESELGKVQMSGTAVILLHQSPGQRSVVVLAASNDGLEAIVNRLLDMIPLNASYALADCLVRDYLALCPTGIANEEVEAELLSGGAPEEPAEEEETETPEPVEEEEVGGFPPGEEPIMQGSIALNETVSGFLELDERHGWIFSGGPGIVDIVVSSDELDLVLELYDPQLRLIEVMDSTFFAEEEALLSVEIPDDGEYTIVVYDYFGDPGAYELTVTAVSAEGSVLPTLGNLENIFIFVDDDGEALDGGVLSGTALRNLMGSQYNVTLWTSSIDGPLQPTTLEGANLIIWDTGDYFDPNGLFDPDTQAIIDYIDNSTASLMLTGSVPILFSFFETRLLTDLEVIGTDAVLLNGFALGDIITLNQSYQTVASETLIDDLDEGAILLFSRGPQSELPGTAAGVALADSISENQRLLVLLFPFIALPQATQATLLANILTWFAQ